MSTVLLFCWCHSDSASVILYFTLEYRSVNKYCERFIHKSSTAPIRLGYASDFFSTAVKNGDVNLTGL